MAFAISSGVKPEAGLYCAIVTGFIISGAWRVEVSGRRTDRRLRRGRRGHRLDLRPRRPLHVHDDGGRHSRGARRDRLGKRRQVHSASRRRRVHQRHRRAHRQHAAQGFLRHHRRRAESVLGPHDDTRSPRRHLLAAGHDAWRRRHRDLLVWRRLVPRVPGYIVALLAGTALVVSAAFMSRRSAPASAASPAGGPPSRCRGSTRR